MNIHTKIAFLGGGNMAAALIEGLLRQGLPANNLHVVELNDETRHRWHNRGLSTAAACHEALTGFGVWVLAVKPQQLAEVVRSAKPFLDPETLVLSIAAGIPLPTLSAWLGSTQSPWPQVVRAMPNTPALVDRGITGLVATPAITPRHRQQVAQVLLAVSEIVWVDSDEMIDAITALSGSGPAYVFRFLEALVAGGEALGLTHEQSRQLALATLAGATELARQSSDTPAMLRERVTSKGGTTEAALKVMDAGGFDGMIKQALQAAYDRAGELSRDYGKTG